MGGVKSPGVYPIEAPTLRLSAMLAQAGGVAIVPDVAQVKLERGGRTGRDLAAGPLRQPALDVALRPGDRIIVEEDRRSFTALGATTRQARVPFNKRDMSVLEAIAAAGGLDGRSRQSDRRLHLPRRSTPAVANRVLGRADLVGPQRMAYLLDLTRPEGLFSAREFVIRDEDTIYITEAPLGSWSRVLALAHRPRSALVRTVRRRPPQ